MTLTHPPHTGPRVSVTIPVFNGARYLADAIESVRTQHGPTLEVLVVDDGSTDGSAEIVSRLADPRCRLLRQGRQGAAAARNAGVAEATGDLLAFLDADDCWLPGKLHRQVRLLDENPALDMVFGHYQIVNEAGAPASPAVPQPGLSLGTMLIRRTRYLDVGPLATDWRIGEFIDWFARAEDAGLRHHMLPDVVLARRVHDANLTGRSRAARADYARIVRAALARRTRQSNQPS